MISYSELLSDRGQQGLSEPEVQAILETVLIQLVPLHRQGKAHEQISLQTLQQDGEQTVLLPKNKPNLNGSPSQDIYDLGLVALELLTGKVPSPRRINPTWDWNDHCLISDQLNAILERMVTPNPSQRWQNASQVLSAMGVVVPATHHSSKGWLLLRPQLIGISLILIVLGIVSGIIWRYQVNDNKIRQENYARNVINRIFSKQEDYFTTFAQPFKTDAKLEFAESLEQLERMSSLNNEYYDYQMIWDNYHAVRVKATAKQRGLKSFTAALFVKSGAFTKRLCETQEFSMTAPQITSAYDIENDCPSGSELYASKMESEITYNPIFIGNAGCYKSGAFKVRFTEDGEVLRQGHFSEFLNKYIKHGLLEDDILFGRIKELRNVRNQCNQMVYTHPHGECITAGFNISLQSSENLNHPINFAVVSYCPPLGGGARPSGSPDLYVFHSPKDSGMRIRGEQTSTTVGSSFLNPEYSLWEILMR